MKRPILALPLLALALAGCAVGPDYRRPQLEAPDRYRDQRQAEAASLADQPWWEVFADTALKDLVAQALERNYDVRIAAQRVDEYRARAGIDQSAYLPSVTPGVGFIRGRNSAFSSGGGITGQLLSAQVGLSWELDTAWGRIRRMNEASMANFLATQEARRGVFLATAAQVAQAYFELCDLDARLEIARSTTRAYQETYDLFNRRFTGGAASGLEIARAESALDSAAATIPNLERQIQAKENLLCYLLGRAPGPIARGAGLEAQPMPPAIPAGPVPILGTGTMDQHQGRPWTLARGQGQGSGQHEGSLAKSQGLFHDSGGRDPGRLRIRLRSFQVEREGPTPLAEGAPDHSVLEKAQERWIAGDARHPESHFGQRHFQLGQIEILQHLGRNADPAAPRLTGLQVHLDSQRLARNLNGSGPVTAGVGHRLGKTKDRGEGSEERTKDRDLLLDWAVGEEPCQEVSRRNRDRRRQACGSLYSQCLGGVGAGGPARGQQGGQQRHQGQHEYGPSKDGRIRRFDPVKEGFQNPGQDQGTAQPKNGSGGGQAQGFAKDQPLDGQGGCSQGQANPEFAHAPVHAERHQAVDADAGQQQGKPSHEHRKGRQQAFLTDLMIAQVFLGADPSDGDSRIDPGEDFPHQGEQDRGWGAGAKGVAGRSARVLTVAEEGGWLRRIADVDVAEVRTYPDDLPVVRRAHAQGLAEGILFGKEGLDKGLVHHDHLGGALVVAPAKPSAQVEVDTKSGKKGLVHLDDQGAALADRCFWHSGQFETGTHAGSTEEWRPAEAGALDPREDTEPFQGQLVEVRPWRVAGVAGIHRHQEQVPGVEPGIDGQQTVHGTEQEARTRKQGQGKAELGNDQNPAQGRTSRAMAGVFTQTPEGVGPGGPQSRKQAGEEPGRHGHGQGKAQDHGAEGQVVGETVRGSRQQSRKPIANPEGHKQA